MQLTFSRKRMRRTLKPSLIRNLKNSNRKMQMQIKVHILKITQVTKNLLLKAITRTHRSLVLTVNDVVTWKASVTKNLVDLHLTNELEPCQIPILKIGRAHV